MSYLGVVRALLCLMLLASAMSAKAVLMELSWQGKWGNGTIVYDNDVQDTDPAQNQWFFPSSIVSFYALGWDRGNYRYFFGTGGSIFVQAYPPLGNCPATLHDPCYPSRIAFLWGPAPTDGSPRYSLEVRAPWPITRDGWLLPFDGRPDFYEFGNAGGAYIASDQSTDTWSAIDIITGVRHLPLQVVQLSEPSPLLAYSLALGGLLLGSRRRQKARAV